MSSRPIEKGDPASSPIEKFTRWYKEAQEAGELQPDAMVLATADQGARPSARVVVLRDVTDQGFVFYTNYDSRKGRELAENPRASLVLFWPKCHRQVRIEGRVERLPSGESDSYFQRRPREAQLEVWASPQSQVIASREWLESRWDESGKRFPESVPRPPWWGGYRLHPQAIEFWEQRPHRLHDRLRYERQDERTWRLECLAP